MNADDWLPTGRCEGHCCRMITLSAPPELIATLAAGHRTMLRADEGMRLGTRQSGDWPGVAYSPDATFVERHFVFVRNSYVDGITRRASGVPQFSGLAPDATISLYRMDGARLRTL